MKSCAQQCRFRESLVHNRIYAAVVLRSRHKNNSLTAPALLEVLTKREKPVKNCLSRTMIGIFLITRKTMQLEWGKKMDLPKVLEMAKN